MSKAKRLLFCGTPEFAVPSLQALAHDPDFQVVQVVSQPDRPAGRGHKLQVSAVKAAALKYGLPVITPQSINDLSVIEQLRSLELDAVVVVAFGQILKQAFLDICPGKCVNLHGSCLPRWRGAAPIQRALMAGDREGGVSLQVVVRKLDAGPVIGEKRIPLSEEVSALELHDLLKVQGAQLLQNEFKSFLNGQIKPQEQDESLVTVAEKIQKTEALIDWSRSAQELHNQVRGLAMGPLAFTTLDGMTFKIHQTKAFAKSTDQAPGTIVAIEKQSFQVACGQGTLEIYEIQPESKKRMKVEEFLRGFSLSVGGKFHA